jgi:hypothetical protein
MKNEIHRTKFKRHGSDFSTTYISYISKPCIKPTIFVINLFLNEHPGRI